MTKLFKASSYTLATVVVFIMSQASALAANGSTENSSLSSAQVVGGVSILLLAILFPTIQKERKSAN